MDVTVFFQELLNVTNIVLDFLPSKMIFQESNPYGMASAARAHLLVFIKESNKAPDAQTRSIIKSSWQPVFCFGKEFRIFEPYKGDDLLESEAKEFSIPDAPLMPFHIFSPFKCRLAMKVNKIGKY